MDIPMTLHNSPAHAYISPAKLGNLQTENMIIFQIMTINLISNLTLYFNFFGIFHQIGRGFLENTLPLTSI